MPIIKSAAKRLRQNAVRARANVRVKRTMRASTKQFRADLQNKTATAAATSLPAGISAIDKAVKKGLLHQNTAARRKSELSRAFASTFPGKTLAQRPAATGPAPKKAAGAKTAGTKKPAAAKKAAAKKPAKRVPAKKPAA